MENQDRVLPRLEACDLLYSRQEIEQAMDKMANQLNIDLHDLNPLVLTIMNGGTVFAGNLLPRLTFDLTVDSLGITRYHDTTQGSNIVWKHKPTESMKDRVVLLLDDILDEGITLKYVQDYCMEQGAVVVYVAVLLEKPLNGLKPIEADYIGLTLEEDRYVFGFGLDYEGYLRNADGIYALPLTAG